MQILVFTTWSRQIHPFDDNNNHLSAAQIWKYPEMERKKKIGKQEKTEKKLGGINCFGIYVKYKHSYQFL